MRPGISMEPGENGAEYLGTDGKVRRGTVGTAPLAILVEQAKRAQLSPLAATEVRVWQMTADGPLLAFQRKVTPTGREVDFASIERRLVAHMAAGADVTEVMAPELAHREDEARAALGDLLEGL